MSANSEYNFTTSLLIGIQIVLIILKLIGVINSSWWIVFIPALFFLCCLVFGIILLLVGYVLISIIEKMYNMVRI
jgi:ABC-type polysaccharide/polyol phosphate export permease